jgi:hypothetical protein
MIPELLEPMNSPFPYLHEWIGEREEEEEQNGEVGEGDDLSGNSVVYNGFDTGFVGDRTNFPTLRLDFFVPFDRITHRTRARDGRGLIFADLISATPMGRLFDDLRAFWKKEGDQEAFRFLFLEIRRGPDGTITPVERTPPGHLHTDLPTGHPIYQHLSKGRDRIKEATDSTGGVPLSVPLNGLWG